MKNNDEIAYKNAKIRVQKLKKFYSHLFTYVVVNILISSIRVFSDVNNGSSFSEALLDIRNHTIWFYWGIGLAFHTFSVFGLQLFIGKDWEERKIRQFMKDEESTLNRRN